MQFRRDCCLGVASDGVMQLAQRRSKQALGETATPALRETLRRDPNHKLALFRIGMYFDAIGRPDRTFGIWRKLLEAGPESAPYMPLIRRTIIDLAQIAGVTYDPPEVKGPSA